jgi:AraC-like DNA-binding protein
MVANPIVAKIEPIPPLAPPRACVARAGHRNGTIAAQSAAVERVILAMHERQSEPFSLEQMAHIALLSPYYFSRVFRRFTGLPPCEFLSALRLQAAKRLLLTTQRSVTEICFDVGYNSLGAFSTRFAELVGVSPRYLRDAARHRHSHPDSPSDPLHRAGHSLTGTIATACQGLVFVGLFSTPLPCGRPLSYALRRGAGVYHLDPAPDGFYYLFVSALLRADEDPLPMLYDQSRLYVAANRLPVRVARGRIYGGANLLLRRAELTDPPLLTVLPFLRAPARAHP